MITRPLDTSPSWKVVPLGTILERIEAGKSPKALDRPAKDGEPGVIKVSAVTWQTFLPNENKALPAEYRFSDDIQIRKGDLLLSRANTTELIAAVVLVDEDYPNLMLSDKILRLVPKLQEVCPNYLLYALRTRGPRQHFESHATGTSGSMRNISQDNICSCAIPLPTLSEQKRIAAILDKTDRIRRKRREAEGLVVRLRTSAFHQLFGDGRVTRDGWPIRHLGAVADVQGGIALSSSRRDHLPLRVPYLRVANVFRDRLALNEMKEVGVTEDELLKTRLARGDVLIVEGHGNRDELGRSAVWDGSIEGCIHQNHLIRVRPWLEELHPIYLSAFLNSESGRHQLLRMGKTTSGLNTISISNVRSLQIMLPPLRLQEHYVTFMRGNSTLTDSMRNAIREGDELFDSLVQRAFRGGL